MVLNDPTDYAQLGHLVYTTIITKGTFVDLSSTFSYIEEYLALHGDGIDSDVYTIMVRTVITDEIDNVTVGVHWDELYM